MSSEGRGGGAAAKVASPAMLAELPVRTRGARVLRVRRVEMAGVRGRGGEVERAMSTAARGAEG